MRVGVRVSDLGRKHFVMEYLILGSEGEHLASGETTLVMYDYEKARSKRIPEEVREAIEAHEARIGDGPSSG